MISDQYRNVKLKVRSGNMPFSFTNKSLALDFCIRSLYKYESLKVEN